MHKKKTVKTIIVEKFKFDHEDDDNDHDIHIYPDLLHKLFLHAHSGDVTPEQIQSMVNRMRLIMLEHDCLSIDFYDQIVTEPVVAKKPEEVVPLPTSTAPVETV